VEWWQYIGLNERHNLAMAIKPYLEDRQAHWQSVCALGKSADANNGTGASRKSEPARDAVAKPDAHVPKEFGKPKKRVRRNPKYEVIDKALQEIAESRPSSQEEILQSLDGRRVVTPPAEPFVTAADGCLGSSGTHQPPVRGFQNGGRVRLAIFAARPEEVVAVTTLGNYSSTPVSRCK